MIAHDRAHALIASKNNIEPAAAPSYQEDFEIWPLSFYLPRLWGNPPMRRHYLNCMRFRNIKWRCSPGSSAADALKTCNGTISNRRRAAPFVGSVTACVNLGIDD